jgi:uncharacterized protein DUF4386
MSAEELRIDESPRTLARLGGANYLLIIVLGIFVELFVRGRIVIPGDAPATAANLRSMESLWRLGVAAEIVMVVCTILSALVFYVLLRPVSRDLALLATFFSLVAISVEAAHALKLLEGLFPLGSTGYLTAFSAEQLSAMASLSMKSHSLGFGISLLLFGPLFLLRGFLIARSGYLPKVLGVLYQITGLAYMTNGFVLILAPAVAGRVFMFIAGPAFIGEASLCLWLLLKGVNVEKWNRWQGNSEARSAP